MKHKRKWIVQTRIPLADVGLEPRRGRTFALNLCRDRICGGGAPFSQWSPTGQRLHLTPNRFGVVRFGK